MSKQTPYVMFIVGRMNPPTPGHVEGLIIPFLHAVREQAVKILSCRDCLTDQDNRWCVPDEQNPQGHCFRFDEIDTRVPGSRELTCSNDRTIISQSTACTDRVDLPDDFEQLINAANLTVRIYLTNTSNSSRMQNPWKDKTIIRKLMENGVNRLLPTKPEKEGVNDDYYVKYYYLENPLQPSDKKALLAEMIKSAIDNSSSNDVIQMNNRLIDDIIVTGNDGEGPFCADQGIKSAIDCAQLLQKRIDPANRTIDPRHIVLVMGEEEDASERQRREKFCFKGALDNDETTKVRCDTLKRITIDSTPEDFQDENAENVDEPLEFNDSSMSASKVRLNIANNDNHDFIRQLYADYLDDKYINFLIRNVQAGLLLKNALASLEAASVESAPTVRYSRRLRPQAQMVDHQGLPDPASRHPGARWYNQARRSRAVRALNLGVGEQAWDEMGNVRRHNLPASLEPNPEGSEDGKDGKNGGKRRKTKKRKTRRKNKRKQRTRKKNKRKKSKTKRRTHKRR